MEKNLGFLAVPNVVMTLIIAQLIIYAAMLTGRVEFEALLLVPKAVFAGEWWRLFSFIITPPFVPTSPFQAIFLAFFWYILWMMSQSLEAQWGTFRLNIFLLSCIIFAVIGAFLGQLISPAGTIFIAPRFLYYSLFLAFATLNPNIQFLVMFVIPMKVKWMAWIIVGFGCIAILSMPTIGHRIAFVAPYLGYLLFFKGMLRESLEGRQRRKKFDSDRRLRDDEALHTCAKCGASDKTHPDRDFRYKSVENDMVCLCNVCRENQP
ncbi:rhomboid family intramembrane serine protease [Coraliomargarita sp. W4R72]